MSNLAADVGAVVAPETSGAEDFGGLGEFLDFADNNFNEVPAGDDFPDGTNSPPAETPPEAPSESAAGAEEAPTQGPAGNEAAPESGGDIADDVKVLQEQLAQALQAVAAMKQHVDAGSRVPLNEAKVPERAEEVSNVDWLGGQDPTVFFEDPAQFNALLNKVFTVAVRTTEASVHEKVIRSIPQIVATSAQQHMNVQTAVESFYASNQDLVPFKSAVSMAATSINAQEPNLPLNELFAKAGDLTRNLMRLRKATAPVKPAMAAGVSGGGSRPVGTQLSAVEQQIAALLDI